ncbi:hypothetical protein [Plantactinospora sp. DSM 117369]
MERNARRDATFATEPFEVAWAGEARWFVRVLECSGTWHARTEISPDGQEWCPYGEPLRFDAPGVYTAGVTHFGHWLRLAAEPDGEASTRLHIYLALKE